MPIHYPDEVLVPYREFSIDAKTYYFTPGGFLYREDPGAEEMGGFFCGYLTDEVWHYRKPMTGSQELLAPPSTSRGGSFWYRTEGGWQGPRRVLW